MSSGEDSRGTILLADDEAMVTDLFSTFLRSAGYEVTVASNGQDALEVLNRDPSSIRLLISDVDMPLLSGVELAIVASARGCPVLLISGQPFPPQAYEAGWDLLAKPFRPSELLLKVQELLSRPANTAGAERPRVIVAEDDAEMRTRLCNLLATDCEIVAALAEGEAVLGKAEELAPDVILLDIGMPGMNGFAVARWLRRSMPGVPILFVTQHSERVYVDEAFASGGSGYVLKRNAARELNSAVRQVRAGGRYLSPLLRAG
jgi:CheY-like chemotaxis protein